jgi:Flp pilus assembly protein TadB
MTNPFIAKQRIDDATESVSRVAKKRLEESAENQRAYERFFNNLALLSGGTVALSVTYLGFLKTLPTPPLHQRWLIASWILLIVCLVCATFFSFFNTSHLHYGRSREYAQRLKEKNETLANEVPNVNVVGIGSKSELDAYIKELREAAALREKDVKWASRREKVFAFLFTACGITACVAFVLGLVLLLSFAVANVNFAPTIPEAKEKIAPAAPTSKTTDIPNPKDQVVQIPCVGIVTFPGSVSDEDASAASKVLYERAQVARKAKGVPPCEGQ